MAVQESARCLLAFPSELRDSILQFLPNSDIKNLRLASSACAKYARLRLSRVFLSANSLNIQVFRAIANHETFRQQITEIIWDDARLVDKPDHEQWRRHGMLFADEEPDDPTKHGCPLWFKRARDESRSEFNQRTREDAAVSHSAERYAQFTSSFSLAESWAYYQGLMEDQSRVLFDNSDIEAFEYGLDKFPSLQRVTITPAAHGVLFLPLYQTPMIRAFPDGFIYPIPRGWPHLDPYSLYPHGIACLPWTGGSGRDLAVEYGPDFTQDQYRELWRGYRAATRILAHKKYALKELVLGSMFFHAGINCFIFGDGNSPEYNDFCCILGQPGFRRLDLSMFVDSSRWKIFEAYKIGFLHKALAGASGMEHVHLHNTLEIGEPGLPARILEVTKEEHFVSLFTMFPIESWPNLRHFALTQILVLQSDLISFLGSLPAATRSIELNMLMFVGDGSYHDLLIGMRDKLDWRRRPKRDQPRVVMTTPRDFPDVLGVLVWVEHAVNDFIYGEGENPYWAKQEGGNPNMLRRGRFGVERDALDELYERPHETYEEMEALYPRGNKLALNEDSNEEYF